MPYLFSPCQLAMSKILLGKKVGMTQVYDEQNRLIPVTVIEAGPCPVVQVKTLEKDGYEAVQIGFGVAKPKNTPNAQKARFAKAGLESSLQRLAEDRGAVNGVNLGDVFTVAMFTVDSKVDIIGTTKGHGFQGVMKRWNFAGGPATHGSMFHNRGGSFGMRQWPGEVAKGKKMPGRFGGHRRTVQNMQVVKVIPEQNLILVKGSVPGPNGAEITVRKAIKSK
jgi:large subunit ribosomal protein L3